jgi:hypothetical protein
LFRRLLSAATCSILLAMGSVSFGQVEGEELPAPLPEPLRIEAVQEPLILDESPFSRAWGDEEIFAESVVEDFALNPYSRWLEADALFWWTRGTDVPALITTSPAGTAQGQAGVLGQPGTTTLFGGGRLPDEMRFGGRIRYGEWLDEEHFYAIEWEYLGLEEGSATGRVSSDGSTILARPFFNALTNQQDAELVSFPGVLAGSTDARLLTSFESSGVRLLINLSESLPGDYPCGYDRWDFLVGYRNARLHDNIRMNENLSSLVVANPGTFDISESFDARTTFHGADLGLKWEGRNNDVTLQLLGKIGIGNNHQLVQIDGRTQTTVAGVTTNFTGGLLTQRTNIGRFERDRFSLLPELGLKLGWQVSDRTRFSVGYSALYWTNVVRAGNQIDTTVNPNLIPPEAVPFTGPLRPAFSFRDVDFWGQGLDLGLTHQW